MRETTMIVVSVIALPLGICLGCMLRPKPDSPTKFASVAPEDRVAPRRVLATKINPAISPPEPIDANSTPEAVHVWRRKDKDELVRRIEKLSPTEADNLCLSLHLIPRDEVFDKVNVRGRLTHYVDGLRTDAEIADVEGAFRDLEERHN